MTLRALLTVLSTALPLAVAPFAAAQSDTAAAPPGSSDATEQIRVDPLHAPLDGDFIFAWLVGELALRNGQWGQALEAYGRAAEAQPIPAVLDRWAQTALLAGDAAQFDRILTLWQWLAPDDARLRQLTAHRERLNARFEAQISERVAEILQKDAEQRERNLLGLPAALAELGNPAQILRLIEQAAAPYREEPAAHLIVSEAARQAGDLDRAWAAAHRALALRPDWPPALAQLAQVALDRFAPESAIPILARAQERQPEALTVTLALAALLAETDHPQRAVALLAPWVERGATDPRLIDALVTFGAQGIEPEQSARWLLRLAKEHPEARLKAAQLWLARGQPRRALALLDPRALPRELAESAVALTAQALARLGRVDEALSRLEAHAPLSGVEAALREARLWQEAKEWEAARAVLIDALATFGDAPQLLYDYAILLERLGARDSAEGYLRKLLAMRPLDVHAINALGYLLADTNRSLDEAERLLRAARALKPNDGFIMDSEGWLRYQLGDYEAARRLIEAAWRRAPDPEIGDHLVAVYQALGDEARAAAWRKRLARQFPVR
ncbi:tetratricopeptide repeat protein [Hydrogenophilus thiooxidans]|uniref:tetratricopeptide repeat protein n=1 Tax=Hydrogenophilus thiooxidans TaxID=2820326 RepID=UPI001C22F95C|nr:tetratricopeptide repeat protein [Hydrogenophilus thiooxidans]